MMKLTWVLAGDDLWKASGERFKASVGKTALGWVASWEATHPGGKTSMMGGAMGRESIEDAMNCAQECFERQQAKQNLN